ncbi:thiol peroxidase [Helicobacter pullorum]|uniref:thiol peroxidase n=1 Tax=Helicobacter pullorum TaxID=35818 RepID=UPI0008168DC0|nr:thiol peroxidase [Helicobacter pullorum]KAB0574102.1 thiol peroxidase [Helicobacter pullorum NCTC 12824]OCR13910.1 lipid hydroperoxide peroxidase [Helicobacter pullorum]OCR19814.1 lipid hydroperoxide peroxidase [Helicobacter pullorum]VEJ08315.1 thiol peroxidase [Helicobacter pullorum]HJF83174.1 thiol peroxidase [Helicobacter pullorum]
MVTFKGNAVSLKGKEINVGDSAPKVELIAGDLSTKSVGGASGKFQIINVVPSLDTGVCATQTRKFNEKAASLSNAEVFVVSLDLPFAQGRFCSIEGIQNVVALSDFKNKAFGESYGVILAGSPLEGLLTRAVFVVNPEGKVVHKEIVSEVTNEPNYDAALAAVK